MMADIEPTYRRRFILKICTCFLVTVAAVSFGLYGYLDRPFAGGYLAAISTLDQLQHDILLGVVVSIAVQLLVFAVLVFAISLFWTHKIAGPLYRLKKTFCRIGVGDFSPMAGLRRGDQLQEVPSQFNAGLAVYGETMARTSRELQALLDELATMERDVPTARMVERERLSGVDARIQALILEQERLLHA
ncbi:MAG: hypothetical protein JXO49_04250 [Deltaproteobacteria bacterium]|nr:hypothetical protein [Candidatus Anaeroferrophillus wilburensis]MBN2888540.1 hypothetical protein [Deltaproteobacteria bacterium]